MADLQPQGDTPKAIPQENPFEDPKPCAEGPFNFNTAGGTIKIIVMHNDDLVEGKVSSDALCLASPVWKKFVYPPWEIENEPEEEKQIDFSEDDSDALLILLNIAHLRFDQVPDCLPYQLLLDVATLCDQYDCVALVRPWLLTSHWLKDEEIESASRCQPQWLFIAWVFGRELLFESIAKSLVKTMTNVAKDFWSSLTPMPPGIIESIQSDREDLIAALLKVPYDMISRYEAAIRMQPKCRLGFASCDTIIYGSLVRGLQDIGFYPRVKPEDVTMSVSVLAQHLRSIRIHLVPEHNLLWPDGMIRHIDHSRCSPRSLADLVAVVLVRPVDPRSDVHREHFKAKN